MINSRDKAFYWLSRVFSGLGAVVAIGLVVGLVVVLLDRAGRDGSVLGLAGLSRAVDEPGQPAIRYVDDDMGFDSGPGTAKQPWKTIQRAADWAATAAGESGATIYVRGGNYPQRVHIGRGGTASTPLVFEATGHATTKGFTIRGDHVTIRGFDITDTPNAWDDGVGIFVGGSHCLLEDNAVTLATRGGILLFGTQGQDDGGSECVVRNNRLNRNGLMGIELHGRDHVIEGNEIWGTIQYHPSWRQPPLWMDADGIRFFGSGHIIRDNYIHHITFDDPANVDPHIDCFQTWGPAYDIGFARNRCSVLEYQSRDERGKGFMIEEVHGPVRDMTITNNIIQAYNHVTAIDAENLTIVNNTFVGKLSFPIWALGAVEFFRSPGAIVQNNIFYNVQDEYLAADEASREGLRVSHNAVYRDDGQTPPGMRATGDVWNKDPEFRNPDRNDFRLRASSPLIDAGASVDVLRDITGQTRPQGKGYDIGAYEFTRPLATATPGPPPTRWLTSTPTPANVPGGTPPDTLTPTPGASRTPRVTPLPLPEGEGEGERAPRPAPPSATERATPTAMPTRTATEGTPSTPTPSATLSPSPTPRRTLTRPWISNAEAQRRRESKG